MKILFFISLISLVLSADSNIREKWSIFKKTHGKTYKNPSEENFRITVFASNIQFIEEHNDKYIKGLVPYSLRMNQFADLLPAEAYEQLLGFNVTDQLRDHKFTGLRYLPPNDTILPQSVDWRVKGAVTQIKDQGNCGSCWAFSTTGAVEGQLFKKTGKLIALSEQQLVDCSDRYGNYGCNGGLMDNAFKYIKENGGEASEDSYPYEGENGRCKFKHVKAVEGTLVKTHVDLPQGDEKALEAALATVGPISVAISAGNVDFLHYGEGIFSGETCQPSELDHGVLLVGYGSENGQDYWIVKNSWSTRWGEDGYIRIARNKGNICGIASMASFPVL